MVTYRTLGPMFRVRISVGLSLLYASDYQLVMALRCAVGEAKIPFRCPYIDSILVIAGIEEVAPEGDYSLTNIPSQSFYKTHTNTIFKKHFILKTLTVKHVYKFIVVIVCIKRQGWSAHVPLVSLRNIVHFHFPVVLQAGSVEIPERIQYMLIQVDRQVSCLNKKQ